MMMKKQANLMQKRYNENKRRRKSTEVDHPTKAKSGDIIVDEYDHTSRQTQLISISPNPEPIASHSNAKPWRMMPM